MFSFFGTTEIWPGQNTNLPELCGRRRIRGISDPVNTIKPALFYFKFTEHGNHLKSNFQKVVICFVLSLNASSGLISRTFMFQTRIINFWEITWAEPAGPWQEVPVGNRQISSAHRVLFSFRPPCKTFCNCQTISVQKYLAKIFNTSDHICWENEKWNNL